ncbi:MAG: metallophosphoesterase [Lachnospiraceae bacterium]|nr:metallophosphoesterase [Lachnospiraceae bacterium]
MSKDYTNILHISDLHFGVEPFKKNVDGAEINTSSFEEREYILEKLIDAVKDAPGMWKPDVVAVSGDVGWKAQEADYESAAAWFEKLAKGLDLSFERFVFCPGNHDIDRSKASFSIRISTVEESVQYLSIESVDMRSHHFVNYVKFCKDLGIPPLVNKANADTKELIKYLYGYREICGINFIVLNSAWCSLDNSDSRKLWIGEKLAFDMQKSLEKNEGVKVTLFHHPFEELNVHERVKYNKNPVTKYTVLQFSDIILNGHVHGEIRKADTLEKKTHVFTSGASYQPGTYDLSCQIIRINKSDYKYSSLIFELNESREWAAKELESDISFGILNSHVMKKPNETSSKISKSINDCWYSIDEKWKQGHGNVSDKALKLFLEGGRCTWALAFSNRIVRRDSIIDDLCDSLEVQGIIALLGAGGEGKSTVLKQICAELLSRGRRVFYHNDGDGFMVPRNFPNDAVLCIDNLPEEKAEFLNFLREAITKDLTVIICARKNEWNIFREKNGIAKNNVREKIIPQITEREEAEKFALCVKRGGISAREHDEIVNLFLKGSKGFLYASMLMLNYDTETLEETAITIMKKLKTECPKALSFLAHIVLLEHVKIKITIPQHKELCDKLGLKNVNAKEYLEKEIIQKTHGHYETRHERISDLFYKYFFDCEHEVIWEPDVNDLMSPDEVRISLLEYYFECLNSTGRSELISLYEKNILDLISCCFNMASESISYLFAIMLDYLKSKTSFLNTVVSRIDDDKLKRDLIILCIEREIYNEHLLNMVINIEINNDNIGDFNEPANFTARWFLHRAYIDNAASANIMRTWAKLEQKQNEKEVINTIGEFIEPAEFTARWALRKACLEYKGGIILWMRWAMLEQNQAIIEGNDTIGDFNNPAEFTARWILRKICLKSEKSEKAWLQWAILEQKQAEIEGCITIGNFNNPAEFTARWILRKAYIKCYSKMEIIKIWVMLEQKQAKIEGDSTIGEFNNPKEFTARWVLRETYKNSGINNEIAKVWAMFEQSQAENSEINTVGDFNDPAEFTARWVLRKAYNDCVSNADIMVTWANLEQKQAQNEETDTIGNFNDPAEFTARWVLRKAYINWTGHNGVIVTWTRLEQNQAVNEEINTIGDFNNPAEFTARWIFREGYKDCAGDSSVMIAWARLEQNQDEKEGINTIGDFGDPAEFTVRWILRKACLEHKDDITAWVYWITTEESLNKISDEKYNAGWISQTAVSKFPMHSVFYYDAARFALLNRDITRARNFLEKGMKVGREPMICLAILNALEGEIYGDSPFCAENLIKFMKLKNERYSNVIYGLRECYRILGDMERIEQYNEIYNKMLKTQEDSEIESNGLLRVKQFANLCRDVLGLST